VLISSCLRALARAEGTNLHNAIFMHTTGTVLQIISQGCFPGQTLHHGDKNQQLIADMNDATLHNFDCKVRQSSRDAAEPSGTYVDEAIENQLVQLEQRLGARAWECRA
jgi:hypothetical protein